MWVDAAETGGQAADARYFLFVGRGIFALTAPVLSCGAAPARYRVRAARDFSPRVGARLSGAPIAGRGAGPRLPRPLLPGVSARWFGYKKTPKLSAGV